MAQWDEEDHDVPTEFNDVPDFNELRELQKMLQHFTVKQLHEKLDAIGGASDFLWTMKTGKKVKIGSMNTPHLKNCILMLEKKLSTPTAFFEPEKRVNLEILKYELSKR